MSLVSTTNMWNMAVETFIYMALVFYFMGVDLGDIISKKKVDLNSLKSKTIAVDAHNTLYQFLASIRMPDGTPLRGPDGEPTSHLEGLLTRTGRLVAEGIKPVFVFDGKPSKEKSETLKERRKRRSKAKQEYEEALEKGDIEEAAVKARQSIRLTGRMIKESKELLDHLGLPYVEGRAEGEAQASYINGKGDVDAVGSQDYDTLLFGAPTLIRNIAITGKRKLPRQNRTITVSPEEIDLQETLDMLGITREQLIDVAILMGTDFNPGVYGIGPKKGLKLIKEHGSIEKVLKQKDIDPGDYERTREIFLEPELNKEYQIQWGKLDVKGTVNFLCKGFNFNEKRVRKALENYSRFHEKYLQQTTIDSWF